ncbi:MAG: hypothetical protein JWP29_5555 [Rhodoferax sp.]|nr:hypothetical protein [Rhodoferax sp.]
MNLVHGDAIGGVVPGVGLEAEFFADGDLRGETDDAAGDFVFDEAVDGLVDVAGVGGGEGGENYHDFAGSVGWGVAIPMISTCISKNCGTGGYNKAALAISNAFCKLGEPFGSSVLNPCRAMICSTGFPLISLILSATPSLMPTMAI